ncbi:MAG: PAS domain S-box protein [Chloroflexi bacterium]|nr:PAS domain S-box protein [Chloroflexota bacterium]
MGVYSCWKGTPFFTTGVTQFPQLLILALSETTSGNGVLIAEVDLSVVQVIISQSSLSDSGLTYVVDSEGCIVAHPSNELVMQQTNVSHLSQVSDAIDSGSDSNRQASRAPVSVEQSLDGQSVLVTSSPIRSLGWHVLVEQPRSQAFASLRAPIIRSLLLLVAGLVLAVLTSMILVQKMVAPIIKLKEAADRVGSGSLEQVDVNTGDELESLGQAFNRMSAQIRDSHATLEDRVELRTKELAKANANLENEIAEREKAERISFVLQRAVEHSPTAILITDTEANIEYVNPKFTEDTGYTLDEAIGKDPRVLQSGLTNREKYSRMWDPIKAGGQWEGELYNKKKNGEFYWSSESILPLKNENGQTTHYLALEHDITAWRKSEEEATLANQRLAEVNATLEQRVADRTSDLQHSNNRLIEAHYQLVRTEKLAAIGQLAAGVAHDLRNPLGAIKNAIYYLNGKLLNLEPVIENPRITEFLKIIDDEVEHSNKIIGDLMDFARITTPTFVPADLGTMVQDSLSKIELREGTFINIVNGYHADSLEVQVDGQQLHRVFQNLIINAQDAMLDGGVITVRTTQNDGFAEVAITDTGEGIKPENINKIFDPLFTTKAKGTGLGLAVCQQIVSKHGGDIGSGESTGKRSHFQG